MIHPEATVDECMEEISALEAEIGRLEREKTKLYQMRGAAEDACEELRAEIARLRQKYAISEGWIERLRADNDWLRHVIANAIAANDYDKAKAALAGKEK